MSEKLETKFLIDEEFPKIVETKEVERTIVNESKTKIFTIISKLFSELSYFANKEYGNVDNYDEEYLSWILETLVKNRYLHYKQFNESVYMEKVGRERGKVYKIDFGVNIGSEFNYPHFCVVIKEFNSTAIVVPLSSVKEEVPLWKTEDNLVIEVGYIINLPKQTKSSYALVNQMQSVSKKRLDVYKTNFGKYITLKLNNAQMDLIDKLILKLCKNYTPENVPYCNDYY